MITRLNVFENAKKNWRIPPHPAAKKFSGSYG